MVLVKLYQLLIWEDDVDKSSCHETRPKTGGNKNTSENHQHPSHTGEKKRLNRIRGQVDGIDRMIDERRYCIDIVTQIRAARSALQSLEKAVLETHLRGCVRTAFTSKNAFDIEEKIKEIMEVIS